LMDSNRTKQRFEWKFKVECLLYFVMANYKANYSYDYTSLTGVIRCAS
jgi:hypothetical protein